MARRGPAPLPHWPALIAPVLAHAFDDLAISVSLWTHPSVALWTNPQGIPEQWYAIHSAPSILAFELEHGKEGKRYRYNERAFAKMRKDRKIFRGTHAGFCDLFVPVGKGEPRTILVAGPFSIARPTSSELHERWRALSGSHGRLGDPSFASYVSATLSTLTLEGALLQTFERLMEALARSLGAQPPAELRAADAGALRRGIDEARAAERMWGEAQDMVDERTTHTWSNFTKSQVLSRLGLACAPQHAVVGLVRGRPNESDPVDDLLRRDAFQRACVDIARKMGGVVSGRVGDHGVTFLLDHVGSEASARACLSAVAERASACARRFDLRLHVGIGKPTAEGSLAICYRGALSAAEKALAQGRSVVQGEPRSASSAKELRHLRKELAGSVGQSSALLSPRFDRYIEAVLAHCGHRIEPVRAQLEAGLERLAEPLLDSSALDDKSFDSLYRAMERASEEAPTVTALVAQYRRLVSDVQSALHDPRMAGRERSIRRALAFIREHSSESLSLARVAHEAGFAPGYFSKLFKRQEGLTFERHVRKLRIARAEQMLTTTALSIERVGKLCGFPNLSYFYRAFKNETRVTPQKYRRASSPADARRLTRETKTGRNRWVSRSGRGGGPL